MEKELSIKNDKSSTGDDVSVQRIQVIYDKTPLFYLRNFFRKFGAIRNFEAVNERNPQQLKPNKKLLIAYVEQEAVRRALVKKYHFVGNEIIIVVSETEGNNYEIARSPEEAMQILDLPEFCIEAIFNWMAPGDQIRFVQSHRIFQTVFETYCRRKYKQFIWNKTQSMSMCEIRDFLSVAGKYMVELNGEWTHNKYYDDVMDLLMVYCPNFEKVTLKDVYINPDCFWNFLRGLRNLRELNLAYYQLDENAFAVLRNAKKLRVLKLANMYHIRGSHLQTLTQLEHLSLRHCSLIKSKYLIGLCEALVNLRTLDISCVSHDTPCFFNIIDALCQRLEVLKMCAPDFNYDRVALLPRLKHLEIQYPSPIERLTIISQLAEYKADQLEVLKIYSRKRLTEKDVTSLSELRELEKDVTSLSELRELRELAIAFNPDAVTNVALAKLSKLTQLEEFTMVAFGKVTNDGLFKLVKNCEKLRILNIQYCDKITNDFVTDVASWAQYRYRKLTIYTYGTLVKEEQLKKLPEYNEAVECFGLNVVFHFRNAGLDDYAHILMPFESELLERRLRARNL